jgi:hypothetical protein
VEDLDCSPLDSAHRALLNLQVQATAHAAAQVPAGREHDIGLQDSAVVLVVYWFQCMFICISCITVLGGYAFSRTLLNMRSTVLHKTVALV